jgi:hypothetical protein
LRKGKIRSYLVVLVCAVLVWIPLYPVFYSLSEDTSGLAVQFLEYRPDYIYFGDSVLATSECESDTRSIPELLPDGLAARTLAFNRGGYDATVWRYMARFIAGRGKGFVTAAVIPINMGAFSPVWARHPSSEERIFFPLASGQVSVREYLQMIGEVHFPWAYAEAQDPDAGKRLIPIPTRSKSIGTYDSVTRELAAMPILGCNQDIRPYGRLLGLRFALNYGAPISGRPPILADIDEMAVSLRRSGIRPVIYLTPVNLDDIRRYGGPDVLNQLNANIEQVRGYARAKNWNLVDLSGALPSADFITRACGCEHVDAAGRAFIAASVAAALQGRPPPAFPRGKGG